MIIVNEYMCRRMYLFNNSTIEVLVFQPWICTIHTSYHIESSTNLTSTHHKSLRRTRTRAHSHTLLILHRLILLRLQITRIEIRHGRRDGRLCRERSGREDEALAEHRRVDLGVREQGDPGAEGVAHGVHDADDDGALLGVGAADLVGPAHAQGAVGHAGALQQEREPLQPRGDVPDRQAERREEPQERRDRHDPRPVPDRVRHDGEADRQHELDCVRGRGDDVLIWMVVNI